MAILKHFAVKNADYGAVIDYLKYQHDEFHLVPILDENGNSMLRDEFYFDGSANARDCIRSICSLLLQKKSHSRNIMPSAEDSSILIWPTWR